MISVQNWFWFKSERSWDPCSAMRRPLRIRTNRRRPWRWLEVECNTDGHKPACNTLANGCFAKTLKHNPGPTPAINDCRPLSNHPVRAIVTNESSPGLKLRVMALVNSAQPPSACDFFCIGLPRIPVPQSTMHKSATQGRCSANRLTH